MVNQDNELIFSTSPDSLPPSISSAILKAEDFVFLELPPRQVILYPWLLEQSITLVSGWRNTGKTWFGLSLFDTVTRKGGAFGPWKVRTPVSALYLDGEMPSSDFQKRLEQIEISTSLERTESLYVCSDAYGNTLGLAKSNLLSREWRAKFKELLLEKGVRLVGFDNISSLCPGMDENLKKDWDPVNQWLLDLRYSGIASMLFHHTGKSGLQRGTSAREDNIDCSILLEWPFDYEPEGGVRFLLKFDKKRVGEGLDLLTDLEFTYGAVEGKYVWQWKSAKRKKQIEILKMLNSGARQDDIASLLKVTKGYVSQIKSQAIKEGNLSESGKLTKKGLMLVNDPSEGKTDGKIY